jgi:hypothetical protein
VKGRLYQAVIKPISDPCAMTESPSLCDVKRDELNLCLARRVTAV